MQVDDRSLKRRNSWLIVYNISPVFKWDAGIPVVDRLSSFCSFYHLFILKHLLIMYYVLYSPDKGYFVAEATTVEQADQYVQNSYLESTDRSECQSFIDDMLDKDANCQAMSEDTAWHHDDLPY